MPALTIPGAIELLRQEQIEVDLQFAEAISLLNSVRASLEFPDRAESSRLLTAAVDEASELGIEIGELFDVLGLVDGAETR